VKLANCRPTLKSFYERIISINHVDSAPVSPNGLGTVRRLLFLVMRAFVCPHSRVLEALKGYGMATRGG
jgi:hypothetical protein